MEEGNHIEGSSGFAYRKQYFHLLLSKAYNFIALTAAGEHPFNCPSIQVKTGLFRVLKKKWDCWHLILDRNQLRDWAELLAMTEKRSV